MSARSLVRASGAVQRDRVLALDAESRMEDALRPVAVVREQEQALRVQVEAADRVEPRPVGREGGRDEIEDGRRGVTIAGRRRHAGRLVERHVRARRADPDGSTVDLDRRAIGSTFCPIVAGLPSTRTRPAATSASAARRDATPAAARTFWIRSSGIGAQPPERAAELGLGVASSSGRSSVAALLGQARRHVGIERRQVVEALEPEPLQELERRAVQDRPARRRRAAQLHDEPPMQEAPQRVVRVDAADPLHGRARDGLAVGDDRERLEAGGREPDRVRADVASDERAGLRRGGQLDPVAGGQQPDAAVAEADLEVAEPRIDRRRVDAGDRRDLAPAERPLGDEQQRLEPGLGQLAGRRALAGRAGFGVGRRLRTGRLAARPSRSSVRLQGLVERRVSTSAATPAAARSSAVVFGP